MRLGRSLIAALLGIVALAGSAAHGQDLISNVFVETNLRQALEDLAAQSGVNIIPDPSVAGVVTVGLQDVTVDKALELVLAGTGFLVRKEPDYYLVYSPDQNAAPFSGLSETRLMEVRYLQASVARSLLTPTLQAYVRVDDTANTLAVTAPRELLEQIVADLGTIDIPVVNDAEFVPLTYVKAQALRDLLPPALQRYVRIDAERNTVAVTAPAAARDEVMQQIARLDVPRRPGSFNVPDVHRTHLVKLNYASATSVLALLPASLQDYVRADAETNALAVSAPDVLLHRILGDIKAIDVPRRHVMLHARVVVLERADLLDFGGEWKWPTLNAGTVVSDIVQWPWELRIGYTPTREFTDALALRLNLLSQNSEATVIANPQVLAQDGKESEIRVTTEEYFQIVADDGGSTVLRAELEKIETGTILKITPQIGRDNELTLNMQIEVSDVVARGEQNLPVVSRRTTHGVVQLESGGTAAVAGLVDTRSQLGDSGVPAMQSIPLLGRAFRTENLNHQARQVAVFVTATIVEEGQEEFETGRRASAETPVLTDDDLYREELRAALGQLLQGRK